MRNERTYEFVIDADLLKRYYVVKNSTWREFNKTRTIKYIRWDAKWRKPCEY